MQLLPKSKMVKLNSDVYCQISSTYGSSLEKFDIQWNACQLPWNQTFNYAVGPFTRTLGTATAGTQSCYGLVNLLGNQKQYDSYRVISAKLSILATCTGDYDVPIIAITPYNWYQGAWSTIPDNIQDLKVMPNSVVKQCNSRSKTYITKSISGSQAFGVNKTAYLSEDGFAARYGSVPTNYGMMRIAVQNATANNFNTFVTLQCRLSMNVILYNSDEGQIPDV